MDVLLNSSFDVKGRREFDVERLLGEHNNKRLNAINLLTRQQNS